MEKISHSSPLAKSYKNFDVLDSTNFPDYASTGIWLRHRTTGLEVFHLLNDDPENLFAFAFRTPPANSTGAAHILEHSVLCGSRRFPLKDPFIRLANQSVKTFLNAMTYPDKTVYPASSPIKADYFNLMSVYGDAVFFPLLDEWTFKQEAHRLELDERGKPQIQGVVYNEMKGEYSSFDSAAYDAAIRSLFPDSVYAFDSGGDPLEIPHFTYADFKAFHAKYYSPENCLLFLYGDIPTEEQLDFVEEHFLSQFAVANSAKPYEKTSAVRIADLAPFTKPVTLEFPAPAGTEKDCTVMVNWLTDRTPTSVSYMESVFLSEILMGYDSSPLSRALIESNLGQDIAPGCGIESDLKYIMLSAGLRGVKKSRANDVAQCITDVLESLCTTGGKNNGNTSGEHDMSRAIHAAVMSVDFANREIKRSHGPYSLVLLRRVLRSWNYGGHPKEYISARNSFEEVKRRLESDSDYVPNLIRRMLLDNPHRSLVTVYPDKQYAARREKTENALAKSAASVSSPEEIRAAAETLRLRQQSPDDDALASCIPHVRPADLSVKIDRIETSFENGTNGVPIFKNRESVNGIVYFEIGFPADILSPEDFPLLPIFSTALTNTGFAGKSWADCDAEIAETAGGFSASLFTSSAASAGESDIPAAVKDRNWVFVRIKMLVEKTEDALVLLADCLTSADFTDTKRLKDLVVEARNDFRSSIIPSGHEYAASRTNALFSTSKAIDEAWNGIAQLFTLNNLAGNLDANGIDELARAFKRIRQTLLNSGAVLHITAEEDGFRAIEKPLERFIAHCALKSPVAHSPAAHGGAMHSDFLKLCNLPWKNDSARDSENAIEICRVPSQVGFAARSIPAAAYGTAESAHEIVFGHWFSNTLLWEQIRTVGGAYGAFAHPDSMEQVFSFVTYRDPKPFKSLDVFVRCLETAASAKFDHETIERAITGAYSKEIQPRSPSSRAFTGFIRKLYGITNEQREEKIARILAVRGTDFTHTAERFASLCRNPYPLAVITGEDNRNGKVVELPI